MDQIHPLLEAVGVINRSLDLGTVLHRITECARDLLRADVARIALREPGEDAMVFRHGVGMRSQAWASLRIERDKGVAGRVFAAARPFRTDDYGADPRFTRDYAGLAAQEGILVTMAVPVLIEGRLEGILQVDNRERRPFEAGDEALLVQVAGVAAIAIRNALSAARRQALARVTRVMSSALEPEQVLYDIADAAGELLDAPFVSIWTADEARQTLARVAVRATSPAVPVPPARVVRYGEGIIGTAAARRETVYVPDVATDALTLQRAWVLQERIRSVLTVPILFQSSLLGVIAFSRRVPFVFDAEDTAMLESFVAQAAIAIRNARLFAESEERRRTAEALVDVSSVLSEVLDPDEVARRTVDSVRRLLRAPSAALYRREAEGSDMRLLTAAHHPDAVALSWLPVLPRGRGLASLSVEQARPLWSEDLVADTRFDLATSVADRLTVAGYRAVLAVPLIAYGGAFGSLIVADRLGRRFTEQDVRLAQAFADRAAVAIENARLHAETERRRRAAEEFAVISRALAERLDVPTVVQRIVDSVLPLFAAQSAALRLLQADGSLLTVAVAGTWLPGYGTGFVVGRGEGLVGRAIAEGRAVWSSDVTAGSAGITLSPDWRAALERSGRRAALAVPLRPDGVVVGVLTVAHHAEHAYTESDVHLLETFADQAAIALRNARILDESQARQARLETLLDVARQMSSLQSVDSLLQRVAEACGTLLHADAGGFRLREGDDLVAVGRWGDLPIDEALTRVPVDGSLAGVVVKTGEAVATDVDDPRHYPPSRAAMKRRGHQAFLAVPVVSGSRILGVLMVTARRASGFSSADVSLATAFASQAATAIDNARLYQETRRALEDLSHTQQQLAQAQKMEAVGQLAGGVAHDFNNLLTVIVGRTDLVLDELPATHALRRDVEIVQSAAARAASLTQQLLAFSRKQVLRPTVLDPREVVEHLLPMLSRLLPESIEVVSHHQRRGSTVRADRGQIEQVLINLAVNARDAMAGGGRLIISTEDVVLRETLPAPVGHLAPGSYVVVGVEDTGSGMTPEVQARIFEPFYTTKAVGKGTGLGLATVYGIASQHGGGVTVDSALDRGSRFRVYLPVAAGVVQAEAAPLQRPVTGGWETVLLVEDEAELRRFVTEILERHGYRVLAAATPSAALALAARHELDVALLLTDVVMPEMSGAETARLVRERRPGLPILYMTGYPGESLEDASAPAGPLIQKPFSTDELLRRVRALLDEVTSL